MPRNGSGTFTLPAGNPVTTGTTISSTWANTTLSDIGSALTGSISTDGQTTPVANLPMGGFAHTGVGNATVRTQYASAGQVQDGALEYLGSVSGTDTITASAAVGMSAYTVGQTFRFVSAGANTTTAVTININGIGAKNITKSGANALSVGDLTSGTAYQVIYDGTQFQLTMPPASNATYTGFKNRIINGAMQIDQRNAGASVTPTNQQYLTDRWIAGLTQSSKFTAQQNAGSVTPPVGFINYLGITSSSPYSILSTDIFYIQQRIEGLNIADLAWGTANAKTVTLSFQVYSSLTGTFGGSICNNFSTRSYPFTYSIPVANTWTTISVTIAGDTTGTWATTNVMGMTVTFSLGIGATYSGTAGSWAGANYSSATGAVSVVGTSGATFYITGVQLEKGSTATSFDYRPYTTELALCQRYFQISSFSGVAYSTGEMGIASQFKVTMRAQPSMSTVLYNTDNYTGTANNIVRVGFGSITTTSASYNATSSGNNIGNLLTTGLAAGGIYFGSFQASAEL